MSNAVTDLIPPRLLKEVMTATGLPAKAAKIALSMAIPDLASLTMVDRCAQINVHPGYYRTARYKFRQQIRTFLSDQAEYILSEHLPRISHKVVAKAIEGSVSHARLAYEVDGALSRGYKGKPQDDTSKRLTINVLIAQHFQDKFEKIGIEGGHSQGNGEETPLAQPEHDRVRVTSRAVDDKVSSGDD